MKVGLACLAILAGAFALPAVAEEPAALDPVAILGAALENRYDVDLSSNIEIVMSDASGRRRVRCLRAVSKVIDDRTHSIGRLTAPEYLRGMTILTIEASQRRHDSFVYLPSLGKARRVSSAQRGDSFLGSDVTYEDLERRRVQEYQLDPVALGELDGEAVFWIRGRPRGDLSHDRVEFAIARRDHAILETRYFKKGQRQPFRVASSPRSDMRELGGHVLPIRISVRNVKLGSHTEVIFRDLTVNPPLDDGLFSVSTLDHSRRLPGEAR